MDRPSGSHRTRSQAAPDWTLDETLTLVNEMNSTQLEYGNKLSSFQKWQSTVHQCNSLGVHRSLNQCKKRWQFIIDCYNKLKPFENKYWKPRFGQVKKRKLGLPDNFEFELFKAIDTYFKGLQGDDGGCSKGVDTDPDSDPEAQPLRGRGNIYSFLDLGPKRQRRRTKPQRYRMEERLNPWRRILNENRMYEQSKMGIKHEACIDTKVDAPRREKPSVQIKNETSSQEEKVELPNLSMVSEVKPEQISVDNQEDVMAATLRENAELITAIVEEDPVNNCKLSDLKNLEAGRVQLIRSQGSQLIDCLEKISDTLSQLCDSIHKK